MYNLLEVLVFVPISVLELNDSSFDCVTHDCGNVMEDKYAKQLVIIKAMTTAGPVAWKDNLGLNEANTGW